MIQNTKRKTMTVQILGEPIYRSEVKGLGGGEVLNLTYAL